jgi:hypothetical protein
MQIEQRLRDAIVSPDPLWKKFFRLEKRARRAQRLGEYSAVAECYERIICILLLDKQRALRAIEEIEAGDR